MLLCSIHADHKLYGIYVKSYEKMEFGTGSLYVDSMEMRRWRLCRELCDHGKIRYKSAMERMNENTKGIR